jgi:hypothetical protein
MGINIEKKNEYLHGIYIYFWDIPINYEIDNEIYINCVWEVQFHNGLNKTIKYKIYKKNRGKGNVFSFKKQ